MSLTIDWMAAASEDPKTFATEEHGESQNPHFWQNRPEVGHPISEYRERRDFPSRHEDEERERRIYRGRTVAMLRRYFRYSMETGRMPSLLGREFFRSKVTRYTMVTFEDRVIFVHDMDRCLDKLDEFSRQIIARHILQEHDQAATGRLLNCSERTVRTWVPIALDLLAEILIDVGLMEGVESRQKKSCQGGTKRENLASVCEHSKNKF